MAYCGPRGIPRSIFLGRGWPASGEPMWLEEDQDAALAWADVDQVVCKRCGTEHADWDPAAGGDPEAFVPLRVTDRGCYLLDAEQANLTDDAKEQPDAMFGTRVVLIRREHHPDFDADADEEISEDAELIGGRR